MHAPTSAPRRPVSPAPPDPAPARPGRAGAAVLAQAQEPVRPAPSAAGYAALLRASASQTSAGEAACSGSEGNSRLQLQQQCATGTVEMLTGQYTGY